MGVVKVFVMGCEFCLLPKGAKKAEPFLTPPQNYFLSPHFKIINEETSFRRRAGFIRRLEPSSQYDHIYRTISKE
jgi:hypothetical protein